MVDNELESEITKAVNDKKALDYKTKLDKTRFIVEMKCGLGNTIKENQYQVTFVKKPWYVRFGATLQRIITKIFTRF
jgi:hypothetical protein